MGDNIPVYRTNVLTALDFCGADAAHFLQGQLTINTEALAVARWRWAAACSRQGRVVAAGVLARLSDERFVFVVSADVAQAVADGLKKYVLRAKVKINVITNELQFAPRGEAIDVSDVAVLCAGDVSVGDEQVTIHTLAGNLQFNDSAEQKTDAPMGNDIWQQSQIACGMAWITQAQSEAWIPQFLNYEIIGGVDFDKGCYVGQEVVARLQHLGEAKRRAVILHSSAPLAEGDVVMAGSGEQAVKAGVIISSSAQGEQWQALAVIKIADLKSPLFVSEQAVQWQAPPYPIPNLS